MSYRWYISIGCLNGNFWAAVYILHHPGVISFLFHVSRSNHSYDMTHGFLFLHNYSWRHSAKKSPAKFPSNQPGEKYDKGIWQPSYLVIWETVLTFKRGQSEYLLLTRKHGLNQISTKSSPKISHAHMSIMSSFWCIMSLRMIRVDQLDSSHVI